MRPSSSYSIVVAAATRLRRERLLPLALLLLAPVLAAGSPAHAEPGTHPAPVRITEIIMPVAGSSVGPVHRVELTNVSDEPVLIGGWRLWFSYRRFPLPPGKVLAPGEVYLVHLGVDGVNDASNCYTGTKYGSLFLPDGWLALLQPIGDYYDPAVMSDFLQWGTPNGLVEPIAVSAGLWEAGRSLDCPTLADVSLQACRDTLGPTAWFQEFETLGRVNRCTEGPVAVESVTWGSLKSLHR